MNKLQIIACDDLDQLSSQANASARLRKNLNVHTDLDDPVQRLFNAMQPNTYVRPHRHVGEGRWEFFQVVRGRALVLLFDDSGRVTEKSELCDKGPNIAVEIPSNTWHTLVSMQPETVLFEVKSGPYKPLTDKDFAAWAPQEGDYRCKHFLQWFHTAEIGDTPPKR
jgi:cupin fold WbuC family metalloprotein